MEGNPTPQDNAASAKSRDFLEGILERIVYFNEDNNFTVARLQVKGQKDLVAIVGNMALPNPGETLRLRGFLDHSSLAVTTVYLRRLEGETDKSWSKVAEAIGV
jgi:hypothetical protein